MLCFAYSLLHPTVVLLLSEGFISDSGSMEQLRLLLERNRSATKAVLLPVFYGISLAEVKQKSAAYKDATRDAAKQQWAQDLATLARIRGVHLEQVNSWQLPLNSLSALCLSGWHISTRHASSVAHHDKLKVTSSEC
jgi:hypothetical protein